MGFHRYKIGSKVNNIQLNNWIQNDLNNQTWPFLNQHGDDVHDDEDYGWACGTDGHGSKF